jgi:hypothetical protein
MWLNRPKMLTERDIACAMNPLNFANNFSAVLVELIDEMQETLKGMHLVENVRPR